MLTNRRFFAGIVFIVAACGLSCADPAATEERETILRRWLDEVTASMTPRIQPRVLPIDDQSIRAVFPKEHFFAVYMPRWPRAITPPRPLSLETIVSVHDDGSVNVVGDQRSLPEFLSRVLGSVHDQHQAETVALAAVTLASYAANGAPFDHSPPETNLTRDDAGVLATSTLTPRDSARGRVTVSIKFEPNGSTSPEHIRIDSSTRAGPP